MSRSTLIEKLQDEYAMIVINCNRLYNFIVSIKDGTIKSYNSLDKLCAQYDAMIEYKKALLSRIEELYADENTR